MTGTTRGVLGLSHSAMETVDPLVGNSVSIDPAALLRFQHDWVRRGAVVKAVVYDRYGLPDVLRVEDVAVPVPVAGQLRVRTTLSAPVSAARAKTS